MGGGRGHKDEAGTPDMLAGKCVVAIAAGLMASLAADGAQSSETPPDILTSYAACTDRKADSAVRLGYCTSLVSLVEAGNLTRAEFRLRDPYVARASIHHDANRNQEALSDLDKAVHRLQIDSGKPLGKKRDVFPDYYVYLLRGQVQFELGRYEAAIGSLQQAESLTRVGKIGKSARKQAQVQIDVLSGAAYGRIGRMSEGLYAVDKAIAQDRGSAAAYRTRAEIYEAMGQTEAAAADKVRAADLSD